MEFAEDVGRRLSTAEKMILAELRSHTALLERLVAFGNVYMQERAQAQAKVPAPAKAAKGLSPAVRQDVPKARP